LEGSFGGRLEGSFGGVQVEFGNRGGEVGVI